MKTRLTLKPGARGTRKLLARYGKQLVCVRYKYSYRLGRRRTTIELIHEEVAWQPKPDTLVNVRLQPEEEALLQAIKESGGRCDKKRRVWRVRYKTAFRLGLQKRILD